MASVALDIACKRLEETPGPELIDAATRLPAQRIDDLCAAILAEQLRPSSSPPTTELWPLVNARTSTFTAGGSNRFYARASSAGGLNLVAAMDPNYAGTGKFPNGMLRTLLYCHGLVIEDPLAMAADMYIDASPETRPLARRAVEAALSSLVEISALLDSGVVQTFFTPTPSLVDVDDYRNHLISALDDDTLQYGEAEVWDAFEATFVEGLQPHLREIWRHVRSGNRHPPLSLVEDALANSSDVTMIETFIEVVAALQPRGVVENAIDVVATTAADLARYGSHHDLLYPSDLYAQLSCLGTAHPVDHLRLNELARIQVPRLDDLLTGDAVRIRQDSDAFAAWRSTLSSGLERAKTLREQLGGETDTSHVVAETVAEAREALFAEVNRSATITAGWRGMLGFVAGALAGASGTATGTGTALAIGTAGGVVPPLFDAIARRGNDREFLRRHYLLFETRQAETTSDTR